MLRPTSINGEVFPCAKVMKVREVLKVKSLYGKLYASVCEVAHCFSALTLSIPAAVVVRSDQTVGIFT